MKNFEALGLSPQVLQALQEMGFENPTDIQAETIPHLLTQTSDIIGLAQTGTGKTAAFGLPLVELCDPEYKQTQALVLAPTRELAQQIAKQLGDFSKHIKGLQISCVYGGAGIQQQIKETRKGPQIIVATPGRLIDLINRNAVSLKEVGCVVLDEADEMLNMGFREELDEILSTTPEEKYTWLFSATMPDEISRMVSNYMLDPHEIKVDQKQVVNKNIDHQYSIIKASNKVEALRRMLDFDPDMYGVVFCRTKIDTQKVAEELVESGYPAEPIHGDLAQSQREAVMKRFRSKTLRLLVATDVAARGIDVNDLTHVVHFALPDDPEYYTHRSGRTARAGKKGISIALITKGEVRRLKFLESKLKINFSRAMIPALDSIAENRIAHWADSLATQTIGDLKPEVIDRAEELLADFSKEELIRKLVSRELERVSKKHALNDVNDNSPLREKDKKGPKPRNERDAFGGEKGMQRFFINIGRMDDFNKGALLRFVCDNSALTGDDIGRIQLDAKHTFIDVKESEALKMKKLNGLEHNGRELRVNAESGGGGKPQRGGRNRPKPKKRR